MTMSFKKFKEEVDLSRPRLALAYLGPVIQDLFDKIEALEAKVDEFHVVETEVPAPKAKTPAKKTPAKKTAATPVEAEEKESVTNTED
jgi:hypothetical protein